MSDKTKEELSVELMWEAYQKTIESGQEMFKASRRFQQLERVEQVLLAQQALTEAKAVIEFYASESSWREPIPAYPERNLIHHSDYSLFDNEIPDSFYTNRIVGGLRAREWLAKWG